MSKRRMERAEQGQPWVIYVYGKTHDKWWPVWSSTRVLGYSLIDVECLVCGDQSTIKMRLPRFGDPEKWKPVKGGPHAKRLAYLASHTHPDRGHPMSWARPMRNMNVFGNQGLDLSLLTMRLEADINEPPEKP